MTPTPPARSSASSPFAFLGDAKTGGGRRPTFYENYGYYRLKLIGFEQSELRGGGGTRFHANVEIVDAEPLQEVDIPDDCVGAELKYLRSGQEATLMVTTKVGPDIYGRDVAMFLNGCTGQSLSGEDLVNFAEKVVAFNGEEAQDTSHNGSEFMLQCKPRRTKPQDGSEGKIVSEYKFLKVGP